MESFLQVYSPLQQLLLAAAAVAAAALLFSALRLMTRNRQPRGKYHPVVGTILHQLFYYRRLYHYLTELSHRHKSYRILVALPFQSNIYTTDPVVVEHLLRTNFENYGKGVFNNETTWDLLGDGIFAVDGDKWRHQRNLASYGFSTRSLRTTGGDALKKNAGKLAQAIAEAVRYQPVIEIQGWLMKATMDSLVEIAFGLDLHYLEGSNEDCRKFVRALDEANVLMTRRFVNPFWKLMRYLNIGSEGALKDRVRAVDDYVYKLIHSKMEQMSTQQNEEKEDMMSRFLLETDNDPKTMTHKYLRDIFLNFVIAGKDSTAGTIAWLLYMLCKHPSAQEKAAQEVKEAVVAGENASFREFAENITEESLKKMQYLHAALSETLRLYPAVPVDGKVCFADDTLPDGFAIRGGDSIVFQPYAMGRMKYLWGEDAEMFRPERWLDANGTFCPVSPFKFSAFQGGPRICLAKDFSYQQMKIFVAVLLRFFCFQLRDEKEEVIYKMAFTMYVDQGVYVRVFPR